jgi:septal ring factor EnvC (AmiA/AmiB activator)
MLTKPSPKHTSRSWKQQKSQGPRLYIKKALVCGFRLSGSYVLISVVARRALADAQRAQQEAESGRKFAEEELAQTQQQIADLESRLEDENREITDVELLRRRLTEELEDERDSHQKELAERDFKLEQTRQKYQGPYSPLDVLYFIDLSLQPSCFRSQKVRGWPSMSAYL